jgi:hypothetical protein
VAFKYYYAVRTALVFRNVIAFELGSVERQGFAKFFSHETFQLLFVFDFPFINVLDLSFDDFIFTSFQFFIVQIAHDIYCLRDHLWMFMQYSAIDHFKVEGACLIDQDRTHDKYWRLLLRIEGT